MYKIFDMKTKLLVLSAMLLLFAVAADAQENEQKKKKTEVTFSVNMHCDNCKARIEKSITWAKGVKNLEIKLKAKTVRIVFDPRKTTKENLQKIIENLGYTCEISVPDNVKRKELKIEN